MALTRRARKRILFLATLLIGAGLVAAGYHLIIVPRRDYRARNAYEEAKQAYAKHDYAGVLKTVGVYLGRNRYDGEALYITADSHFHVALACAAQGDSDGWIKNYRGARDYAMAARAQLGSDPRPLELLLTLHSAYREIAEVENIASILGESSPTGMQANVYAAMWAGNHDEALRRAERFAEVYPLRFDAQSLLLECMVDPNDPASVDAGLAKAAQISGAHPDRADLAILFARIAVVDALRTAGDAASPQDAGSDSLKMALTALDRVAEAVPEDKATFAEYLVQVDQLLCCPTMTPEQRDRLVGRRAAVIDVLLKQPDHRQWAAATAAAWAWSRTGRTADGLAYLEKVADIPDEGADESLLGWRGACSESAQAREQAIAALGKSESAQARLWRHTLLAISARLAGDQAAYQEHLDKASAIADTSAVWLPFFEMEVADSLARANDRAGAIGQLRSIVDRVPAFIAARIALYQQLLHEGRTDDALSQAARIRYLRTDDAESMFFWTVAAIAAAESGTSLDLDPSLAWLEQQADLKIPPADRREGWQNFATLVARCLLIGGDVSRASQIVGELGEAPVEVEPSFLVDLLEACKDHGLFTEAAPLASKDSSRTTPQLLVERAEFLAHTAGPEAAREHLLQAIKTSTGEGQLNARLAYVSFLDRRNDPDTRDAIAALLDASPDSIVAITQALSSLAIWTDGALVDRALAQLKKFGEDESMYRIYNAARFLAFEYDPAGAADHIQEINDILDRDPQNVRALRMMAALLLKTGRGVPTGAINYMQQAARLGDVESQFDLVNLLLDAGKPDDARQAAETLRTLPHPDPSMLRARAKIWQRLGLLEQAERDLASIGPDATQRDVAQRALVLVDCKKPDQARQLVEQLIQKGLDDPDAARLAAGVFAATGDPARGRSLLEQLPVGDDSRPVRLALADYLMLVGNAAEAASIYEQAVVESKEPEIWLRLAAAHARAGQQDLACEALTRAPDSDVIVAAREVCTHVPSGPFANELLARWFRALTSPDTRREALALVDALGDEQHLAAFTDANRSFALGWIELASFRSAHGNAAGAAGALRSAIGHVPVDSLPAALLTVDLVAAQKWDEAAVAIDEWRSREGESFLLHVEAAIIADHAGKWRAVVELLEPYRDELVKDAGPDSAAAVAVLATGMAGAGRAQEANDILWPLVEQHIISAEVYAYVATRAADRMSADDLKSWTERVQPLLAANDPALIRLQFALALALEADGDAAAAERLYRVVIGSKVAECLPPAANNLAEILRRDRRNLDEAVMLARSAADATDAAIKAASSPPPQMRELLAACLDTLGLCQLANGSAADAVATFQKAFEQSPQKLNLRAGLVVALERVGNQEDADKVRTEGLRLLGPSFQEALDQLRAEYGVRDAAARLPASAPPS